MIGPGTALVRLVRAQLVADPNVTALVDPASIREGSMFPEKFPCILLGAGTVIRSDAYTSWHEDAFMDAHIWARGSTEATQIAEAICSALKTRPWSGDGWIVHGLKPIRDIPAARSDKDIAAGLFHRIVSIDAILQGLAA